MEVKGNMWNANFKSRCKYRCVVLDRLHKKVDMLCSIQHYTFNNYVGCA